MTHPLAVQTMAGNVLEVDTSELILAEWTDEGGGQEPPLLMAPRHIHHADDEAFYVLEGRLAFDLDGQVLTIEVGGAVMIPRGTAHTWWNPSPERCRYLIIMTRQVHELVSQLHAPGETRSTVDIFRAYESEIVDQ